ncbi:MAG: hypothetical protein HC800_01245, partial [Phormidesmis sp. RL_2_1]|nr:hypothetical protein [Phormidesmis sp. RL_2_1]
MTLPTQASYVFQISFGEKILASASEDGIVRLWNLTDGSLAKALVGHEGAVETVAFRPTVRPYKQQLLSGGIDGMLRLWAADGETLQHWRAHDQGVSAIAWNPKGTLIASGSTDKTVKIWADNGTLQHVLTG